MDPMYLAKIQILKEWCRSSDHTKLRAGSGGGGGGAMTSILNLGLVLMVLSAQLLSCM